MRIVKYNYMDMFVYCLEHNGESLLTCCADRNLYNMSTGLGWQSETEFDEMMKTKLLNTIKLLPVEYASEYETASFYRKQLKLENEKLCKEIDKTLG